MAQAGGTLRIFANSTFGELKAERNALQDGRLGSVTDCPEDGCRG